MGKSTNVASSNSRQNQQLHPRGCGNPECSICQELLNSPLVNPHCEVCHGAGFIHPWDEIGRPIYSKVIACPTKGCYRENWNIARHETLSQSQTFETFKCGKSDLKRVLTTALNFANETGPRFFIHFGAHGCGKTHLLNAIYNGRCQKEKPVRKFTMNQLFYWLQAGIKDNTIEAKFIEIAASDMLLLDDLDMRQLTDWKLERLEQLLDYRMQNQLWTHITTNNTLEEIKAKSPRLEDRFGDLRFCLCVFNGAKSYRIGR